ncbi:sensor histidine kinase [Thalassotalea insulae]|uniref:histidine kinase n=1 Tax=Thalassotalea insulae TaxID=2056778 RepID=A0ABQ6GWA4_9GAMM|nr:ATP-binding protein [Thalassotalea insulae]GLX80208.1 sensor histidine kinase [Thalassotalea insulae]
MKNTNRHESFERQITKTSLYLSLVPGLLLAVFLYLAEISIYLKIIIFVFCSSVLFIGHIFIWRRLSNQLRTTTNVIESLIVGDTTLRPNSAVKSGALAELNQVINIAAEQLAEQRLLSKEHHIAMSKVLEHINVAVICVDHNGIITLLNPKAEQLFHLQEEMIGMPIEMLGLQNNVLEQRFQQIVTLTTDKIQKRVFLQNDNYQLNGQKHTLLFLNDVQKLLQNEERVAWQRLLRVLSHEINNSLAPISSIGESLTNILNNETGQFEGKSDISDGLAIMTQRALMLNSFIKEYQSLTRLPEPEKSVFSLMQLIKQQVSLFPKLTVDANAVEDTDIYADPNQIAQVIVNLLKNALQAMEGNKNPKVAITQQLSGEYLQLNIIDNGNGISNPDNLFIPFYTTKKDGSGIGLVLSRQIMFNHGGDLSLINKPTNDGAIASILLPYMLKSN